jgi:hypothetical protein
MDSDHLNKWLTLAANVGVIAGIVFLALELRQNNELLEAETRAAANIRLTATPAMISTDIDLADVLVRAKNGEALSESEELRVIAFNVMRLRGQEAFFGEYQKGTVELIPIDDWRRRFHSELFGAPAQSETWSKTKSYFGDDFVQFIENEIIDR